MILCGGAGARLWPASRADRPKPFIKLFADRSLFQDTVLRVAGLPGAPPPLVVCGAAHVGQVTAQLAEIGVSGQLMVEPEARDSAPAILAAAAWVQARDPLALALVVASDHYIPDAAAFRAATALAAPAAVAGAIVTFGIRPTSASRDYGYIAAGGPMSGAQGLRRVTKFIEKPDAEQATVHVANGLLWNSGNFLFLPQALLAEARQHAPGALDPVLAALADSRQEGGILTLGPVFAQAQKISIDFAIMERTTAAAVLPVDYVWSDVGSWDAVWSASAHDQAGNALSGKAFAIDSHGTLVQAWDGMTVVAFGVEDLVIVAEPGRVLVARRSRTSELKVAVEKLDLPPE